MSTEVGINQAGEKKRNSCSNEDPKGKLKVVSEVRVVAAMQDEAETVRELSGLRRELRVVTEGQGGSRDGKGREVGCL